MNFSEEMQSRKKRIEGIIDKYVPREEGYQKTVIEAMNYSLLLGGKRLRPMLMEETFRLFGGQNEALLEPFMAAVEMIHSYSLVHDDLPAMDNDEYRRGHKTTHRVYGEAMAILAGDGLLNYAVETAIKAFDNIKELAAVERLAAYECVSQAIIILMNKSGIYGMIGGQTVDIEEYQGTTDRSRLDFIYKLKTSALIEASMMIGAVLAGADEAEVRKIEAIAGDIGHAFQIKDDILDVTSSMQVLGKPVHSDEKNDKVTYVTLLGLEAADKEVARLSNIALKDYDELGYSNEYLRELVVNLINRDR